MDDWFERLVRDVIWQAIQDALGELAAWGEAEAEAKLAELTPNKSLSSSPDVATLDVTPTTIRFVVRGRFKLFGGAAAPFIRLEVLVSKDVPAGFDPPIRILEWDSVVGDLRIESKDVFRAELGFGYDNGAWLGRGALKILPAGFGLDVLLGGLDERGLMIGVDVDLPSPIPLGSTGIVLSGLGGDFAYNFVPRLESGGAPVANPDARAYVAWAKGHELDRWMAGPVEETAVGVALRADFGDAATFGRAIALEPIGLAVLVPGPVFVLGGAGCLLRTDSARAEGYVAVDVASGSIALGLGVKVKIPKDGPLTILQAEGSLDAFFSFQHPELWFIHVGTNMAPVKGKVLAGLDAEVYLMIDNTGVRVGAGVSIGGKWEWWIITVTARAGLRVGALVGWNPAQLEGAIKLWGELGLKVWEFKFALLLEAEAIGRIARPTQATFQVAYRLDLPWPIPDVEGVADLSYGETPDPPPLASPLLRGEALVGAHE
jgi:hypothetical protein